jgi:hypothetical protein
MNKCINDDGLVYCMLWKALHGCIQATEDFLQHLVMNIRITNKYVMQQVVDEDVFIITIHIGDIYF